MSYNLQENEQLNGFHVLSKTKFKETNELFIETIFQAAFVHISMSNRIVDKKGVERRRQYAKCKTCMLLILLNSYRHSLSSKTVNMHGMRRKVRNYSLHLIENICIWVKRSIFRYSPTPKRCYLSNTAEYAVDGKINKVWNSGTPSTGPSPNNKTTNREEQKKKPYQMAFHKIMIKRYEWRRQSCRTYGVYIMQRVVFDFKTESIYNIHIKRARGEKKVDTMI